MAEDPPVTLAEGVGKFVLLMAGILAVFCLYAVFWDKPFGPPLTQAVGYTGAVFLFVFYRWRGLPESFSLRDTRIQHQIPRLIVIHTAFLTLFIAGLSDSMRRQMPDSWLVEHGPKHDSYYEWALVLFCTLTFYTQVFISRRILRQAIATETKLSGISELP